MKEQRSARGQISLVSLPEAAIYMLVPSQTQIVINTAETSQTPILTCEAYIVENDRRIPLSNDVCTIKYYTSEDDNTYKIYTGGIEVNAEWNGVQFGLFLNGQTNPICEIYVSIVRDGQVDTNFRVWVGAAADPNTLSNRPWYGEEHERQEDSMHIGDYYVSPNMTYYCFEYNKQQYTYVWSEVTDPTLKQWLERANRNTSGYIIPDGQSVVDYFKDIQYKIGDLWANATYPAKGDTSFRYNGVTYTSDKPMYNNEPLICKKSRSSTFTILDWQPVSDIRSKLKNTGIDIEEHKIVLTGDELWLKNNADERVAFFNTIDGDLKVNTQLLAIEGDVSIDGSLILGSIVNNEECVQELDQLMTNMGYDNTPTAFYEDGEGNIVANIGENEFKWSKKTAAEQDAESANSVQFDVTYGENTHTYKLNSNGLLEANDAVFKGQVIASAAEFVGPIRSQGGQFSVDNQGVVHATAFEGIGKFMDGTTVITKDNFYDYFMKPVGSSERYQLRLQDCCKHIQIDSMPNDLVREEGCLFDLPLMVVRNNKPLLITPCGCTLDQLYSLSHTTYTITNNSDRALGFGEIVYGESSLSRKDHLLLNLPEFDTEDNTVVLHYNCVSKYYNNESTHTNYFVIAPTATFIPTMYDSIKDPASGNTVHVLYSFQQYGSWDDSWHEILAPTPTVVQSPITTISMKHIGIMRVNDSTDTYTWRWESSQPVSFKTLETILKFVWYDADNKRNSATFNDATNNAYTAPVSSGQVKIQMPAKLATAQTFELQTSAQKNYKLIIQ